MPKAQPKRWSWVNVDQVLVREDYGSFDAYCWQFVDGRPRQNRWTTLRQIAATTRESDAFSKDLKGRGFSFVGSTVMYAHMQAVGMVNDHLVDCFRYRDVRRLGIDLRSPTASRACHGFWSSLSSGSNPSAPPA